TSWRPVRGVGQHGDIVARLGGAWGAPRYGRADRQLHSGSNPHGDAYFSAAVRAWFLFPLETLRPTVNRTSESADARRVPTATRNTGPAELRATKGSRLGESPKDRSYQKPERPSFRFKPAIWCDRRSRKRRSRKK